MDTYYPINYNKSIQKQRLVYITNFRLVLSYVICYVTGLAGFIMILALIGVVFANKPQDLFYFPALTLLLWFITLFWMIANLILMNVFIKIDGKEKEVNRNDMITTLHQYYKLNNLDIADENIIRDIKPYKFILNGRIITCLLDNEILYLNITSLQNFNNLTPYSGLYNYYKCKRIARRFRELQINK